MSPIFERTFIPDEAVAEYVETVERLGGTPGKRSQTRAEEVAEITPEWTRQVAEARELLAQFVGSGRNRRVTTGVNTGLHSLVHDIYSRFPEEEPRKTINQRALKLALVGAFEGYLPDIVPDDIVPNVGGSPGSLRRKSLSKVGLTPREVSIGIKRYGLADGIQTNFTSLASQFSLSSSRIINILKNIPPILGRNPAVASVLFVQPPSPLPTRR